MQTVSARHAFYAGSFDPLTTGHLSIVQKAVESFDRVVIAIGFNPKKTALFPVDVRLDLIQQSLALTALSAAHTDKITLTAFSDCYMVSAAVQHGCGSIIRGVRNSRDFEEENLLATVNDSLCDDLGLPRLQTHLFNAEADKVGISSSMVKNMLGFAGWPVALKRYVPDPVLQALITHFARSD